MKITLIVYQYSQCDNMQTAKHIDNIFGVGLYLNVQHTYGC